MSTLCLKKYEAWQRMNLAVNNIRVEPFFRQQETLSSIVEQGAKFSQREYADLLSLQARSQTIRDNNAHERRLKRLIEIFHK